MNHSQKFVWWVLTTMVLMGLCNITSVHAKTAFREYQKIYKTYPFSDANPVPIFTDYYPYFRFDSFTDHPEDKSWNVVEISNEYLTLTILPQIGGKIWEVTDKTSGRSIVYANPVIKFRDIAMRGPWTSGGIEMNIGIIGHTPNCSSPVDYFVRKNEDGSVSCYIGAFDLITRTRWTNEIRLPDKSSHFSVNITWQNSSGQTQPYYTWTNVGMPASEDLQYINFGTHHIGHDGEMSDWPIDPKTGKDLSWYRNNDFGSYKSYHIVGQLRDFFGVYYHDPNFGTVCVIPTEGKRGRKIWMWGHSREGMIWEDLLTDPPGSQYIEIQSGRLFNQTSTTSSKTPFKHHEFSPHAMDAWTEWWMPVQGIDGYNSAGILGAMNVNVIEKDGKSDIKIGISPSKFCETKLQIYEADRLIKEESISLTPMVAIHRTFSIEKLDRSRLRVVLGDATKYDESLIYNADESLYNLHRPWRSIEPQSDDSNAYALYISGREKMRERQYNASDILYKRSLEKDAFCVPSLVGLAENANRRGETIAAIEYCQRALSVDLYDAAANYQAGMAYADQKRWIDAEESYSLAALSDTCRTASLVELAKVYINECKFQRASDVLEQALGVSGANLDAKLLLLCTYRISGDKSDVFSIESQKMITENPLNHAVRIERFLAGLETAEAVRGAIRWELPHETFLEIAIFYERLGRREDAKKVLELAIETPNIQRTELLYWLAFVTQDKEQLQQAESESPEFCFPFRAESRPVFRWALEQSSSQAHPNLWKTRYYNAILEAYHSNTEKANTLLRECREEPDFAPFYLFRGQRIPEIRCADYRRAFELNPKDPRTAIAYAEILGDTEKTLDAMAIIEDYADKYPLNPKLILMKARGLLQQNREFEAWQYLRNVTFLPNEGSVYGRVIFHEAAIRTAAKKIKDENWSDAIYMANEAKSWPENLGSGKPYPEFCDERLEDWILWMAFTKLGNTEDANAALNRILKPINSNHSAKWTTNPYNELLFALAIRASGDVETARNRLVNSMEEKSNPISQWSLDYFDGKPVNLPEHITGKVLEMIR